MYRFTCKGCGRESTSNQSNKKHCGSQKEVGSCSWIRFNTHNGVPYKKKVKKGEGAILDMTACRKAFDWLQA